MHSVLDTSVSNFVIHCICIFLIVISGEKFKVKSEVIDSEETKFVQPETEDELPKQQKDIKMTKNGNLTHLNC